MSRTKIFAALVGFTAWATLTAGSSVQQASAQQASDWPSHPLRLIVPAAAGGSSDAVGRILADSLGQVLGQPVVVENMPSAASILGSAYVAKSAPDGYTMLISSASVVINPLMHDDLSYVASRDLTAVSQINTSSQILVVNAKDSPAKSLPDLVSMLKAKPNAYNFGSSGVGSTAHLMVELFMAVTGTQMTHVPYTSSGETAKAILGNEVQTTIDAMPALLPFVKSGGLRALAVSTPQRAPELPDTPTIDEFYPSFPPGDLWLGILVRNGTPQPIVDKLSQAINKAVHTPEAIKRLADTGSRPVGSSPTDFAARIKADDVVWTKVIKDNNIKAQ